MNNKLWFKAKMFGWGWYPITWQGWLITILYVISIINPAIQANKQNSISDFLETKE